MVCHKIIEIKKINQKYIVSKNVRYKLRPLLY